MTKAERLAREAVLEAARHHAHACEQWRIRNIEADPLRAWRRLERRLATFTKVVRREARRG